MLYLAFIFHMHQPYYKNLLTGEAEMPWVRLHGTKDYLDMVRLLEGFPAIRQTFNLVPSLIEQLEDYTNRTVKDKFLELSYKPAQELNSQDKAFILNNFFAINKDRVISTHPRYYDLYLKKLSHKEFSAQDFLDLQVWFNLAWIDPSFREGSPELTKLTNKARFFTEEEKRVVLDSQLQILEDIIPAYNKFKDTGRVEITVSPYYHPILPLLYNTQIAKEANTHTVLPKKRFAYPEDAKAQIDEAIKLYKEKFNTVPCGMWPSEEAVSEHILPFIIQSGISWIVSDEGILFKSLKLKKRNTELLYQPYILKRKAGNLNIIFRDRNLSDLLGFVYHAKSAEDAVNDFISHLQNISVAFKDKDILVTIAMDGENAWEFYKNDGIDFLKKLYQKLSESSFLKTTTVSDYLKTHPPVKEIKRLAAGSWIFSDFGKWIGNPHKVLGWEVLAEARKELQNFINDKKTSVSEENLKLILKQMYILEGSDWFWWFGEEPEGAFDKLFRTHMLNFYQLIGKKPPEYLNNRLQP